MSGLPEDIRNALVKIMTPLSVGVGFKLKDEDLIVLSTALVHGHNRVIIEGTEIPRQMASVILIDPVNKLALCRAESHLDDLGLTPDAHTLPEPGDQVYVLGFDERDQIITESGVVEEIQHNDEGTAIWHDAWLSGFNSGGPLLDGKGLLIGINDFSPTGRRSLARSQSISPLVALLDWINEQEEPIKSAQRCYECGSVFSESSVTDSVCPACGEEVPLIGDAPAYTPVGVARTIEDLMEDIGYRVELTRNGYDQWEITQGSANISIAYHEKSGMIVGEAYLCGLPQEGKSKIFEYLLQQNDDLRGLTFSLKDENVVLSILIYDHFLKEETGKKLLKSLFEMADHYDDILLKHFGAVRTDVRSS